MLKRLKRIVYQVPDLTAAKNWYATFLGLEPVFDTPLGVIFLVGDNTLSLVPSASSLPVDNGRIMTYWEVDDVDASFRRMIEMGASSYAEAKNVMTIRTAQVRDPFGNIIGLSGPIPGAKDKTVETQPSHTAMAVSFCRALAARDERDIRRPDAFAELFLTEEARKALENPAMRDAVINRSVTRPLYGYLIARSAFVDAVFEQAIRDNIPQIAFIGAGYDTRAFRFREKLGNTRVYELDAPATQNRKKDILQKESILIPPQLSFVPVNFKTDDLGEVLERAGLNKNLRTLFIWEGVMYYLPAEAVDKTLKAIKANSIDGSLLCLDYMTEKLDSPNSGEPFLSWIDKRDIKAFLEDRGFRILDHVDSEEMIRRFLTLPDGTIAEQPFSRLCLVLAQ